jgi:hypothetical protein
MSQDATEHSGRKIQQLIPVCITNPTSPSFDQNFIGVRHGHQYIVTVLLPVLHIVRTARRNSASTLVL